jgi:hypothetical protein
MNFGRRLLWWRIRKGDYQRTFGTESGQRVLREIYRECGFGNEVHVPGDPYQTAYNAGLRRAALRIAKALGETEAEFLARSRIEGVEEYGE